MSERRDCLQRAIERDALFVQQGGLPRHVAALIPFPCPPGPVGIRGNTIRVCGQGLIGA